MKRFDTARLRAWLYAAIALLILPFTTQAFYEEVYELEEQAATALIESGLYDYAEDQIKHLRVNFRQRSEEVDLVEAQLLMAQRRREQAMKILDKVPKTSTLYPKALLVKVSAMTDPKEKVAAYKLYFTTIGKPETEIDQNLYRRHVMRYVGLLLETGDTTEAQKALELLKNAGEADSKQLQRRIELMRGQILLAAADDLKTNNKPAKEVQKIAQQALNILKDLVWEPDYFAAMAYPEIMHAYNLLDDAANTKQMFETAYTVLKQTEDDIRDATGNTLGSPLGPAIFYLAESFLVRAQETRQAEKQAKTPEETADARGGTINNLTNAAKLYYKVYEDYTQSGKAEDALAEIDKIKRVLSRYYNVEIEVGNKKQQIDVMMRTANENYREGRLSAATDAYMEAIRLDLNGKHVLDASYFAAASFYRNKLFWEAMALNDLLLEKFPDAEQTGNSLYNTGIALFKHARELEQSGSPDAIYMMNLAVSYLTHYVESAPTHPFAAATAYRIAESQYAKANKLRQEVKQLESRNAPVKEINQAVDAAKAEFMQAIPLYESVVENHPASRNALLSYKKLGWIYQIVKDHELEAARNFIAYSENVRDDVEAKIETKFMGADNLMRANDPDAAIKHFQELLTWTQKGGAHADAKNARKYHDATEALLPWAYDQKAQQLMAQLPRLEDMLAEAKAAEEAPPEETQPKVDTGGENNMGAIDTSMGVEELQTRIADVKAQAQEFQQKALEGLIAEVKEDPKAKEAAASMAKIGAIYGQREDFDNAAKWLERLDREFPETPAGQQALFTLFRSYLNIDAREKASQVADRMVERLNGYNISNVMFIATRLFERDEKLHETVLNAELALAANREVIRRARDRSNPDYERLQNTLQRALFFEAKSLHLMGQHAEAIAKANDFLDTYDRSPYYFDVLLLRGRAHRASGDMAKALDDFQRVLGFIDQNEYKATYYEAVVEAARTLNKSDQIMRVKQAVQRVKPVIDFVKDVEEDLQPWIEAMYYELARSFAFLNEMDKAQEYQQKYLQAYIRGVYRKDIVALPAPKF